MISMTLPRNGPGASITSKSRREYTLDLAADPGWPARPVQRTSTIAQEQRSNTALVSMEPRSRSSERATHVVAQHLERPPSPLAGASQKRASVVRGTHSPFFPSSQTPSILSCAHGLLTQQKPSRFNASREHMLVGAEAGRPNSLSLHASTPIRKHPANFPCILCSKQFTRAYTLRAHLRTHTHERPFVCTVCFKAFARQSDCKSHKDLHGGERKFVCGRHGARDDGRPWKCIKRFSRKATLTRHQRSCKPPSVSKLEKAVPVIPPATAGNDNLRMLGAAEDIVSSIDSQTIAPTITKYPFDPCLISEDVMEEVPLVTNNFICWGELKVIDDRPEPFYWGCLLVFDSAVAFYQHLRSEANCMQPLLAQEAIERRKEIVAEQNRRVDEAFPRSIEPAIGSKNSLPSISSLIKAAHETSEINNPDPLLHLPSMDENCVEVEKATTTFVPTVGEHDFTLPALTLAFQPLDWSETQRVAFGQLRRDREGIGYQIASPGSTLTLCAP